MKRRLYQTDSSTLTSIHTHCLAKGDWWWSLRCGCNPRDQILPYFSSHRGCAIAQKSNQVIVTTATALVALISSALTPAELVSLDAAARVKFGPQSEWHPATLTDAMRDIEILRRQQFTNK